MNNEARPVALRCVTSPRMDSEVQRVADAALSTWRHIFAALVPIIGQRGSDALIKRSLSLAQREHHCLAAVVVREGETLDLASLHPALSQQAIETASAAQAALLQTFVDLLSHLMGAALTDRVIGPMLPPSRTGSAPAYPSS